MKRDIAIVRADIWGHGTNNNWAAAEKRLRELGEKGYSIISVVPVANPSDRGDVVWTLERTEEAGLR